VIFYGLLRFACILFFCAFARHETIAAFQQKQPSKTHAKPAAKNPVRAPAKPAQTKKQTSKPAEKPAAKAPTAKPATKTAAKPAESSAGAAQAKAKQQELERIRQEIARDKAKLQEVKKKERNVSTSLQQFRQRDAQIRSSLETVKNSLARVQDSLRRAAERLSALQAGETALRREYADLVYTVSRAQSPTTEEMLLGAASMPEASMAEGVMRRLGEATARHTEELRKRKDSVAKVKERFASERKKTEALKAEKEVEKTKVQSAIAGKTNELKTVQSSKQKLLRRLQERNASAKKLEALINSLVNKSQGLSATPPAATYMHKNANKSDDNTAEQALIEARAASIKGGFRRRSLPWPTDGRTILHKFGRYANPATGALIENPGVGVAAKNGSTVRAVARGVVALVNWLPGYGSIVILDHGNTFRSVYANLASVGVSVGQKVNAGAALGKSGRSLDGEYLHFELWQDRNKLNPVLWLE
jgi:septal ring factor EnvC (AmiA/AmiB activator)